MTTRLLDILVCPQCKAKLALVEGGQGLLCKSCQLKYLVKEGIPIMLVEEALDMRGGAGGGKPLAGLAPAAASQPSGGTQVFKHRVVFRVIAGPDEGVHFDLMVGTCRALGRHSTDVVDKTTVLSVDWAISLDEETKGLVLQYIAKQFRKPPTGPQPAGADHLGAFKRSPDVVFKDITLSRLHCMIFFDTVGVGILDLVSKNGTFVNGEEIESRLLKKGDTIELGESKIVFEG